MRALTPLSILLATSCGSVTLRYIPDGNSTVSPASRSEPTDATAEELLAEGWARTGWIYRHSTRGNEKTGTEDMLAEAARHGGERVRFIRADKTKETVYGYVVDGGATYAARGTRGHVRRIGEVWRRDPDAAREQQETLAHTVPDPVIAGLSASCEANDAEACHALAEEHRSRRRVGASEAILAFDHRACALGSAPACLSAALQGLFDIRFAEVRARERDNAQRGCQRGDATCCELVELFAAYDRGPDAAAHTRATELGVARCEGGDVSACRFAAARFAKTAHGQYGPTDPARADALYARATTLTHEACARGDVGSCESTLHSYPEGAERARARVQFREQLEPICEQGMIYACFRMAWHYYNSKFSEELQPKALHWFGAACDAGIAEACFLEGSMLDRGRGVPRDPAAAAVRHARGCALGHPNACASLEPR